MFNRIAIPSHVFVMIQIEFRFRMIARCGVCEQNTVKKKPVEKLPEQHKYNMYLFLDFLNTCILSNVCVIAFLLGPHV